MTNKRYFVVFATLIELIIIGSFMKLHSSDDGTNGIMLDKSVAKVGKDLGKKYRMSQCGSGGGVNNGIWLMSLDFQRYGPLLLESDARRLLIACINDFLDYVNEDETIRPYLKNYPFTPQNLSLVIFNYTTDKKNIFFPYIMVVSIDEGKICYCTKEESQKYGYKSEKFETYDEAIAILQKEKDQSLEGVGR